MGLQRLDFIIGEELAVELKTGAKIAPAHRAQTEAYLRTTRFEKGLIICLLPIGKPLMLLNIAATDVAARSLSPVVAVAEGRGGLV